MADSRIGGAYVDIRAKMDDFHNQMQQAKGETMSLGSAFGGLPGKLAAAGAALGVVAGAGIVKSISLASDLNETLDFTGVVFGKSADIITQEADRMNAAFGTSKKEFVEASTQFGLAFKGIGASQEDAAKLGLSLSKLAADISSAKNADIGSVLDALNAGLKGESDPLEAFSVQISAAKVEAKALEMGFEKVGGEISDAGKKAATMSLIFEQTKDFQGNLIQTQDSVANQWRKITGQIESAATSFGQKLLPAAGAALTFISETFASVGMSASEFGAYVTWVADAIKSGFETAGRIVRNFGDYWVIVRYKITEFLANIANVWDVIPENLQKMAVWIGDNWLRLIGDAVEAVWTVFANLGSNIRVLWKEIVDWLANPTKEFKPDFKPILEGFRATVDALPEFTKPKFDSFEKEINEVLDRIDAKEKTRQDDALARRKKAEEEIKKTGQPDLSIFKKLEKGGKGGADGDKMEFFGGGEDLAKRIQQAVWREKDDTPQRQLAQLTGINEGVKKLEAAIMKGQIGITGVMI